MALEGIIEVVVFPDKATVWILVLIYNENKALVDPTSVKVSITDPDGTVKVDEGSMTQYESTTGIYQYFYHKGATSDPMDDGQWKGEVLVTDGSGTDAILSPQNFAFEVK